MIFYYSPRSRRYARAPMYANVIVWGGVGAAGAVVATRRLLLILGAGT